MGPCPAYDHATHTRTTPEMCPATAHIYWRGVDTCPWCGGPAYIYQDWQTAEWRECRTHSGWLHTLRVPACFGPKRYVCSRCWKENSLVEYAREHAYIFCVLCPVVGECDLAYE